MAAAVCTVCRSLDFYAEHQIIFGIVYRGTPAVERVGGLATLHMFRSLGVGAMNWAWAKDSNNLAISLVLAALTIGPCRCPIRRWYNWLTRCEGAWGLPGARRTISAFLCWICPIALSGKCPRQGHREGAKGCLQMTKQPNPCSPSCAWCPVSKMVRPLN